MLFEKNKFQFDNTINQHNQKWFIRIDYFIGLQESICRLNTPPDDQPPVS